MELAATTPPSDTIDFSNTTVVRDQEGNLTIWVGNEKMLGVVGSQIGQNSLTVVLSMARVRLAEGVPATPVVQTSNVLEFKKFRAAQAELVVDNTATAVFPMHNPDGDA